MLDRLSQFFDQEPNRRREYEDFSRRYEEDADRMDGREVSRRYRDMMDSYGDDDDDEIDEGHERAFSRMSEGERRALAQYYREANRDSRRPYQGYDEDMDLDRASDPRMLGRMTRRAARQDPDLLEQLVGPDSPLNSTGAKVAMAGAAAMLASKFLGKQR